MRAGRDADRRHNHVYVKSDNPSSLKLPKAPFSSLYSVYSKLETVIRRNVSVLEQGRKYIIVRKVMNKRQTGIKRITKGIERDRNKKKKRKSEQANKQAREREGVRPGKRSKSKLKRQTIRKRQRPRRHNLQVKRTAYYRDFLFL